MNVGFTGTREGMTEAQAAVVYSLLIDHLDCNVRFHHGQCVGADEEAAEMAKMVDYFVIAHPPADTRLMSSVESDDTRPPKPYLDRNRDIVDESDVLLATPREMAEQQKGGTWYTVRYARKQGKTVQVVLPDGSITS